MIAIGNKFDIAGYICGNTSTTRQGLKSSEAKGIKVGGVSGPPLKPLALLLCHKIYRLKEKNQIIIGCGGISNGQDAYEFIRAGASLLQLYTALVYEGLGAVKRINDELSSLLKKDKLTLAQAIGIDCSAQTANKI